MQRSKNHSSRVYYDRVASAYDNQLKGDPTNGIIREQVKEYFVSNVPKKRILDFGGGTGLDLQWLLDNGYHVVFCEPSSQMKLHAVKRLTNHPLKNNVIVLAETECMTDNWKEGFPFSEQVDGCLANFAVFNCIKDVKSVFAKLSLVMKPQGHLIATILDTRFKFLVSRYLKSYLKSFLHRDMVTYSHYNNVEQEIYLHRLKRVVSFAQPYFRIQNIVPLGGYGFLLLHLTKK